MYSVTKKHKEFFPKTPKYTKKKAVILSILSVIGIIITSDLIVDSAVYIAEALNISQKIIAMTIIVIGTSLPEFTITVISAKKAEFDMAIGNIIGTNIFNICVVLGIPVAIFGGITPGSFEMIDLGMLLISSFLLLTK